jgi:hypothetical protein
MEMATVTETAKAAGAVAVVAMMTARQRRRRPQRWRWRHQGGGNGLLHDSVPGQRPYSTPLGSYALEKEKMYEFLIIENYET